MYNMTLYINTTQGDDIIIAIKDNNRAVAQKKIKAKYSQAEKLLPMIDKILAQNKLNIKNIKKVQVANQGGTFTALRVGVVTANALGYALGVSIGPSGSPSGDSDEAEKSCKKLKKIARGYRKFNIVEPIYSKEPNITKQKAENRKQKTEFR